MKKILIITNHSYMLYRFRRELIEALKEDHEVVLSMPFVGHEEDFQAMGLRCINTEVDRRGINPKTDLKLFMTYRKLLKAERPDLVITYSIKPNIYAGLACRLAKIPLCANVQGLGTAFQRKGLAQFVTLLYRTALRRAKTVFFENEGNAQEFIDRKILPREQITVLPGAGINLEDYAYAPYPGVDTNAKPEKTPGAEFTDESGKSDGLSGAGPAGAGIKPDKEQIRFLYLGRIMKEKGIDELFGAMRKLREKFGDRVILDLVGFFDDDYKEQVEELEAAGIAVFHGFQTEPRPYYAGADCVVLPSYHEGMSNVLLEAAATGRPVITSDIPGCREAVEDGVTGLLCRAKDTDSLYQQMERMAELPASARAEMGVAGRKKMEREFDKRKVVKRTVERLKA